MATDDENEKANHAGKAALAEIRLYFNTPTKAVVFTAAAFSRQGIPKSLIQRAEDYITACAQGTGGDVGKAAQDIERGEP